MCVDNCICLREGLGADEFYQRDRSTVGTLDFCDNAWLILHFIVSSEGIISCFSNVATALAILGFEIEFIFDQTGYRFVHDQVAIIKREVVVETGQRPSLLQINRATQLSKVVIESAVYNDSETNTVQALDFDCTSDRIFDSLAAKCLQE